MLSQMLYFNGQKGATATLLFSTLLEIQGQVSSAKKNYMFHVCLLLESLALISCHICTFLL